MPNASWLFSFLQFATLAVVLVVFLAYKYSTYHFDRWKKLGVPHDRPTPMFGNFRETIMGRVPAFELIHALYRRYDGQRFFGAFQGRDPILVVRDPALLHAVMVGDFSHFNDRISSNVSFRHDKLFEHLVNLRGERWKGVRTKLSPTFSAAKLKSMLADIHECTARLVDNLNAQIVDNNGVVDVNEAAAQYTTDTIGVCAFGLDCKTLSNPNSEFRRTGRDIFTPSRRSAILNFIRLIGLGHLLDVFRIRGMSAHIYDFFDSLLESTMNQHKSGENTRKDFIALLVKLQEQEKLNEKQKKLFTDNVLAANAFVFFVAGFETTASTISYCLYELAMNPEIQNQLRKKIQQTLDANEGKLSYDTLKDMPYLDMIINETFRIHPPAPIIRRVCTKKYTIPDSDVTLNVGETIIIPIYALHHDPKYYPKPEVFDPERFNDENKSLRPHSTFIPFGDGPRICIGMRFAMMETKTGLAEIISKFEVRPCKETLKMPIKIKPSSVLLSPVEPICLLFKKI